MIQIQKLTKSYGDRVVLDVSDHSFAAGRIHVLAGPNGAGKSTLMRIINGLEEPSTGSAVADVDSRDMVFCAQKPYMFSTTVQRNVEFGLRARGVSDMAALATAMMERLGLSHLAGEQAVNLSSGETQRVSLARALILKPRLLLLDEPFANLDESCRRLVEECILEQHAEGSTIVIATHLLQHIYHVTADVTRMEDGRILPMEPLNILEGIITHDGDHVEMKISDGLAVSVATDREGQGRGILPPEDVVLSLLPLKSSMRNCFQGRVISIERDHEYVDVVVDIGVELIARIMPESAADMQLAAGGSIYAAFKATAVRVY